MSETTPLIKAALNLRVGVGFDVYNNSERQSAFKKKCALRDIAVMERKRQIIRRYL